GPATASSCANTGKCELEPKGRALRLSTAGFLPTHPPTMLAPMRSPVFSWIALAVASGATLWPTRVSADTLVINRPGSHPNYVFEAEPHLLIGALPAPGPARGTGVGLGLRGTVEIVDNGFIGNINNTVGVGFGADWVHYSD